MTALEKINAYLDTDLEKVAKIIEDYPTTIPTRVFAEMLVILIQQNQLYSQIHF